MTPMKIFCVRYYWTLISFVPHLSKLHRPTTCKERGTQDLSREFTRLINKELSDLWKVPASEGINMSGPFMPEELDAVLKHLEPGKSPDLESIFLEFVLHARSALKSWLCDFLTSYMCQLKITWIWRRELKVAISKPETPLGDPKSYHPISLAVSVPFKIL